LYISLFRKYAGQENAGTMMLSLRDQKCGTGKCGTENAGLENAGPMISSLRDQKCGTGKYRT